MNRIRTSLFIALVAGAALVGCFPQSYSAPVTSPGGSARVVTGTGGGTQYLYVPTTNIQTSSIQQVIIQSADGRTFTLGADQVQSVAAGRVALGIPAGVTQGNVVIIAGGVTYPAVPFYIAQPMTTLITTTVINPACGEIAGTWVGNISDSDPNAVATAVFSVSPDCRSVSGFIHWEGPRIGSVDSTIAGHWDPNSRTLVASDTQLFNVRPVPGGGFCPTDRYQLSLMPDGRTLAGLNIVTQRTCAGQSRVHLHR